MRGADGLCPRTLDSLATYVVRYCYAVIREHSQVACSNALCQKVQLHDFENVQVGKSGKSVSSTTIRTASLRSSQFNPPNTLDTCIQPRTRTPPPKHNAATTTQKQMRLNLNSPPYPYPQTYTSNQITALQRNRSRLRATPQYTTFKYYHVSHSRHLHVVMVQLVGKEGLSGL